ncbi:T9SS type A sorting domain-containing protein [Croceiramulus getboli]|nr:T9SS type A sorting domain-containing protein [Flavobacteriaceae bacterium YJPT1-3]
MKRLYFIVLLAFFHVGAAAAPTTVLPVSLDDFKSISATKADSFEFFVGTTTLTLKCLKPLKTIEVYNVVGQPVIQKKLSALKHEIDISSLSKGVYIAKVKFGETLKTFRFIKKN